MAQAIEEKDWSEVEETGRRNAYWEYLVQRWLYQAPFAVMPQPAEMSGEGRKAPSPEALQDFGWVMVPESQISH